MFILNQYISARLACVFLAASSMACTATALTVASDHPGSPDARTGRLPVLESLKSDLTEAASPVLGPASGNDQGAHAHDHGAEAHDHGAHEKQSGEAAASYTCSMHPEVVTSEPGKCPKCGMKLIPKKDEK